MFIRFFFFHTCLLFSLSLRSQTPADRKSRWVDSMGQIEAAGLQQQFHLAAAQTDLLHQAYVEWYAARQQVIARYWKTDSFLYKIARANRIKDSVYIAVLGQRQFHDYKDTLFRRQERAMRTAAKPSKPGKP